MKTTIMRNIFMPFDKSTCGTRFYYTTKSYCKSLSAGREVSVNKSKYLNRFLSAIRRRFKV